MKEYPIVTEIPVAWGEMDAMGHVNNIIYFRYFETARVFYFARINALKFIKKLGLGPILKSTTCDFKAPLSFPDKVYAGTKVSVLEDDAFTMKYIVFSQVLNRISAEGIGEFVFYDYKQKKRAAIPEQVVRRIQRLEKL